MEAVWQVGTPDAFAWPQLGPMAGSGRLRSAHAIRVGLWARRAVCRAARGAVGLDDYQDVIGAVDAALERGIADPERLAIGGWSQADLCPRGQ